MKYQREFLKDIFDDLVPLFDLHYAEVKHFDDIPLSPDKQTYLNIEDSGVLRVFTIRNDDDELVGYNILFIREHMHYSKSVQAVNDVIFIREDSRGQGRDFIEWCDELLKKEGVDAVYQTVKATHNWGPMLERQGYKLIDLTYGKRL